MPLHLRAELRDLGVEQQARIEAMLRHALAARALSLQRPSPREVGLVLLQQESHPQVIRRQHRERIAHERDEAGIGIEAADALDRLRQIEVRHRPLADGALIGRAMAEAALEIIVGENVRGRVRLELREVVRLLRAREADLRIPREIAAERRRAAARCAHDEEVREGGEGAMRGFRRAAGNAAGVATPGGPMGSSRLYRSILPEGRTGGGPAAHRDATTELRGLSLFAAHDGCPEATQRGHQQHDGDGRYGR